MSVQRAVTHEGDRPLPIRTKGRPVTSCGTEGYASQRRGVVLAAPEGFRAHRYGEGWWFLEWNTTSGVTDYEEDHEFSQGVRRTGGTRGSIFAVPPGDERSVLVRAVGAGGAVSRWVKCTVNSLGRLTVDQGDDPEPPPPGPPLVPVVTQVSGGRDSVAAVWEIHPDASRWNVRLLSSNGAVLLADTAQVPRHVFRGLAAGARYGVQVRAVGGGGTSAWSEAWWVWTLEDDPGRPSQPRNLAVHCITTDSAQVTWDNDPEVDYWVISVGGRPETTYDNGRRLVDLRPGTDYAVTVTAHRGGAASVAATADFVTLPDEADPEAPLPTPHNLLARAVSATEVELSWEQSGGASTWLASVEAARQRRVDRRRHGTVVRFGGLAPGATYTAQVYAQQGWDVSPIARQSVTLPKEG